MAAIPAVITTTATLYGHVLTYVWAAVSEADTCTPVQTGCQADRSVQAYGTWGGATLTVKGSNEVTNDPAAVAHTIGLHDPQGVALTMTADKIEEIAEATNWLAPEFTTLGAVRTVTILVRCQGTL